MKGASPLRQNYPAHFRVVLTFIALLNSSLLFSQAGTYYNSISESSPTFVNDLKTRIRSPYTRVSYDLFDETMIANFTAINNGNGTNSVFCVYSGYEHVYSGTFSWGTMSREHTWAHSWMPTYPSSQNDQFSDQHLLFPTHQNNANGRRSNHPFGRVVNVTYQFLEGKLGTDSLGNVVYEPRDGFKGDLARALFYTSVRYDGISGSWTFGWLDSVKLPSLGEGPQNLQTLLNWHYNDPPDKWEVERNNYAQSVQQNRNPFTDRPEYVRYIDFKYLNKLTPVFAAEPSGQPTSPACIASGDSVTFLWNDAEGVTLPDSYLLLAYDSDNYIVPADGSVYSTDTSLSDGKALVYVPYSSANSFTFRNLQQNKRYYFTMYSVKGANSQTNYKITGTIPRANIFLNSLLAAEPSNHATGFSVVQSTPTSLQIAWNDALPGSQPPTGYLIAANTSNNFILPSDGNPVADDPDLSDGIANVNIAFSAANVYQFSGLLSGTTHYFRIYSYNGTGSQINFKTDGAIPSATGNTSAQPTASVTVLSDNFSRPNGNTLGNSLLPGIPWVETETLPPGSVSISSSRLRMGSNSAGRDMALLDLGSMQGYVSVFDNADTTLVWALNMRQSRTDPSGHDNNNYGIAFILGKTTSDLLSGNGYAVVLGQSGSADAVRLARFSGGVSGNNRFTNVISGGDYSNQFLSIKVTYQPQSRLWSLFVDSSSAGFPRTDPRQTSQQIGIASDSTFTSQALQYSGCLWNHVSSTGDSAIFDDIYVTDLSVRSEVKVIPEGLFNQGTGRLSMKDSVRIYIHSPIAPYQRIDSAIALVDSVDFTVQANFGFVLAGNYYISVIHRNSVETWSAAPVQMRHGGVNEYDFTSSASAAYGNNLVLVSGKYCIFTGDVNRDGNVDISDLSIIDNDAFGFENGYLASDLNGDGFADITDIALCDNNLFNFIGRIIP